MQHDYIIDNQAGASFRADVNNALQAIVSQNSGATAPTTTYAYQYWVDTSTNPAVLKQRDSSNASWISLFSVTSSAISVSGNLGIGVTPNAWSGTNSKALDVGAWASIANANAFGAAFGFNGYYNGTSWIYKNTNSASKYEQDGAHRWYTAPSGTAGNAITYTPAMTLDANANLSVGASSNPNSRRLLVNGTGSGSTWVAVTDTALTSNEVLLGQDPGSSLAYLSSSGFGIAFNVNGSERARIESTGRLTTKFAANGTVKALTYAATVTPDFNASNHFSLTLTGNATLANPTNVTAGQSGVIVITQDATGSRTMAFGSYWKFAGGIAPTLTTTASAVDVLAYYVESSTRITARIISDVK